jgi:WD40 repeat protein
MNKVSIYKIIVIWGAIFSLLCCGGNKANKQEFEKIYNEYRNALEQEDLNALKKYLSSRRQAEVLGKEAATKLKMVKSMLPQNTKITGVAVSGDSGNLEVTGDMAGQQMTGKIMFAREGGKWKIDKEEWQISFDTGGSSGSSGFSGETVPFMDDINKPPHVELIMEGHQDDVSHLAFTPDGRYLISASYSDFSLRMWDPIDGVELATARTPKRIRSMAISADSAFIYTGDAYKNILRWPIKDNTIGAPEKIASKAGDYLSISSDGKFIAATAFKEPVLKLSLKADDKTGPITKRKDHRVLLFSPSNDFLVGVGEGNYFTVWDTRRWREKRYSISKVSGDSSIFSIDISQDEKYMATGHSDSSIVIYDFQKRKELHNYFVKDASTNAVKFSLDNKILATAHYDNNVYLWDVASGQKLATLPEHREPATCLAFSPDGSILASGGEDRVIVIWRSGPTPKSNDQDESQGDSTEDSTAYQKSDGSYEPEWVEFDGHDNLIGDNNTKKTSPIWISKGEVSYELKEEDNYLFAIRRGGMFQQDVPIEESTGKYALIISWGSSERYNNNLDQTGLPYLYGYFLSKTDPEKINDYLKGQQLLLSTNAANEWGLVWGVFEIPADTGTIRFFMHQADGHEPQNGSAAYFDEPGIFIFDSEDEAKAFVKEY